MLANGVNTEGISISAGNTTSSNCLDANNYNEGVGSWHPSASDWDGTTWKVAELDAAELESLVRPGALEVLNNAITSATIKNGSGYQGIRIGFYRPLTEAIATAQAVYDNASATSLELYAAEQALTAAVDAALIMPEAGKQYYIRSGLRAYYETQGSYKGMYADTDGHNKWKSIDEIDKSFVWTWTAKADGWVVQNVGNNKYLNTVNEMSDTEPNGTIKLVSLVPGEWNIKATGGAVMHTNGHASGAGVSGTIVQWGGDANSGSSWVIVSLEDAAEEMIEAARQYIANANIGTSQIGQTTQEAVDDIEAAIDVLSASDKTIDDLIAFKTACAAAEMKSVWPVFVIHSAQDTYGVGNSIYEDEPGAQNHFTATDKLDYRQMWVFEGLESTEIAPGSYKIKNVLTGKVLHCGSANDLYSVRHIGNDNDNTSSNQWLIYPNNTSGTAWQVHAQNNNSLLVTWNNTAENSGSCWTFSYVGTSSEIMALAEDLQAYLTIHDKYAQANAAKDKIGTGLGQYSETTAGAIAAAVEQYDNFGLSQDNVKSVSGLSSMATSLVEASEGLSLNLPKPGQFLRIRNVATPANYAANDVTVVGDGTGDNTIFYYTEFNGHKVLVGYANGLCPKQIGNAAQTNETHTIADNTMEYEFTEASSNLGAGQYFVKFGTRHIYGSSVGGLNAGDTPNDDSGYRWTLEEVEMTTLDGQFSNDKIAGDGYIPNVIAGNVCKNLQLIDKVDFAAPVAFTAQNVSYNKTGLTGSGWYSAVLPFEFDVPAGIEVLYNATVSDNSIKFSSNSGPIAAGTPFIYRTSEEGSISFTAENAEITTAAPQPSGALKGTYSLIPSGEAEGKVILNSDGSAFVKAGPLATIPAFRAYLEAPSASSATFSIVIDDELTGVLSAGADLNEKVDVYSLDGKLVRKQVEALTALQGLQSGVYVVNGKKIKK